MMTSIIRGRSLTPMNTDGPNNMSTTNERILGEVHKMYVNEDTGLMKIADEFGLKLLPPRKKIVILLIGNHSAGKSSFINWYIEENVQKTGVAIETQGFTMITSGKKRESLTGEATLFLYPRFKALRSIPGVIDFLSTEISPSKQKKFGLVTFVDTPGLVDGDMQYPFDVNKTILWLGGRADLIFVFFDPMGQALCKRTLTIVEKLSVTHSEKMRFYLSKADQAGSEPDRQRVMMQIVQELCKRPALNRQGFDMQTIYVPDLSKNAPCVNQIDEVCREIEKTISATVQNTLNALTKDCNSIEECLSKALENDDADTDYYYSTLGKAGIYCFLTCLATAVFLLLGSALISGDSTTSSTAKQKSFLPALFASSNSGSVLEQLTKIVANFSALTKLKIILCSIFSAVFFGYFTKRSLIFRTTITRRQRKDYEKYRAHLANSIKNHREKLYVEYLEQSVGNYDL